MQAPHPQNTFAGLPQGTLLAISGDGYVRLTFETFLKIGVMHLCSGIDQDKPLSSGAGASYSIITGYTEWVSHTAPALSLGWDWQMTGGQGGARLICSGTPGSNLMLLDQRGNDLGPEQTGLCLSAWLEEFNWQAETLRALSI